MGNLYVSKCPTSPAWTWKYDFEGCLVISKDSEFIVKHYEHRVVYDCAVDGRQSADVSIVCGLYRYVRQ